MIEVPPSPASTTTPDTAESIGCVWLLDSSLAYKQRTACVAMYMPGALNVSKSTSAVYSRFSGVLLNGSVIRK